MNTIYAVILDVTIWQSMSNKLYQGLRRLYDHKSYETFNASGSVQMFAYFSYAQSSQY